MKIAYVVFAAVLISGCTGQYDVEGLGEQLTGGDADQEGKKLTTTITAARDLTGTWTGTAEWSDNVGNPACSYFGDITFNFQQNDNTLAGTWQANINDVVQHLDVPCAAQGPTPVNNLQGTVSSSSVYFTSGDPELVFDGTFTTDLLDGSFESCPGQCPGGTVDRKSVV